MEGRHIEAKEKTGDAGNGKSQSRVRGKDRCVVERGDWGDARSRWEGRPGSLGSAELRLPPGLIHSKVRKFLCIARKICLFGHKFASFHGNRPALKAVVEGECSGAHLMDRQFLGYKV